MSPTHNGPPQSNEAVERLAPRERVAVVRYKKIIYAGPSHIDAFDALCAEHHITNEEEQDDLFAALEAAGDCGFATTKRAFVSRAEGAVIAEKSGQLKEAEERENFETFVSEDVLDS